MTRAEATSPASPVALARLLGRLLAGRSLTVSVAESCTGGMVGAEITGIAGSSAYFKGGVIAYSNEVKRRLLCVPARVLQSKGAVSAETVAAMAAGAKRLFNSDCAMSVSGIAGPGGGTKKKPVGLVYVGIAAGNNVRSFEYRFRGSRREIRMQAVREALKRMIEEVEELRG